MGLYTTYLNWLARTVYCLNVLSSWLKCYNVINSHLATLFIMSRLISEWIQYLYSQKKKKKKRLSHLQKLLVPLFWNNIGISYTNVFWILYEAFKLKAGNNEPKWHGRYTAHVITVVDNTGETWLTSSVNKGYDGVSASTLYIFL